MRLERCRLCIRYQGHAGSGLRGFADDQLHGLVHQPLSGHVSQGADSCLGEPSHHIHQRIPGILRSGIRPKAASEIKDIEDASLLLGHTKGDITERVYRRVGAIAKPSK